MLDPHLLAVADTVAAVMFALGFLVAYLVDRKLAVFLWWAGVYLLIAVSVGMTNPRIYAPSIWVEAVSWTSLYGAVSLAAYGMFISGEGRTSPHKGIAAGAVVLAAIVLILSATDADTATWVLLGGVPTLGFTLYSFFLFLRRKSRGICDWCYGLALLVGASMIVIRAIWFSNLFSSSALTQLASADPTELDQAFILSSATIFTMAIFAFALILRISLTTVNQMRERSMTDSLTGLLNRATFDEQAKHILRSCEERPLCAVILDIDHFKSINDTYGHQTGDRVISELGRIIRETAVNRQIAGRIGGEEFAIILPSSTLTAARLYAEAIRIRFAASDFDNEISRVVTLSAGVALRQKNEPLHALLARTDEALYNAKKRGRNLVVIGLTDVNADHDMIRA